MARFKDEIRLPPLKTYLHKQISVENAIHHQNTDYILKMNRNDCLLFDAISTANAA